MTSTMRGERGERLRFIVAALLLFAAGAYATAAEWRGMSAMPGVAMPGGWSLSMIWWPMPGTSWSATASDFVRMWSVMMIPMMVPVASLPMWEYRAGVSRIASTRIGGDAIGGNAACIAAMVGYAVVWSALGIVVFALGALTVGLIRHFPVIAAAVPALSAMVVVACGAHQFSDSKRRRLARCAAVSPAARPPRSLVAAWRDGARLGVDCCTSCANWMMLLLAIGVMQPIAMLAVTGAIAAERSPAFGARASGLTGGSAFAYGLFLFAQHYRSA